MSCLERFVYIVVYAGGAALKGRLLAKLLNLLPAAISELSAKDCKEGSFSCRTRAHTRAPPDLPIWSVHT
jgi:hypothetical protein